MKKRQIVNIINFLRGCEPRFEVDLVKPMKEQLKLLKRYRLQGTFLLQHNALTPVFVEPLKTAAGYAEAGGWFEMCQSLAEEAGVAWHGRFPWDWHANVGFSPGYAKEDRMKLVDAYMKSFHAAFGCYPASVGSWIIDAFTLDYMQKEYGVIASCNCRDQWGTDGYTLWGGYYSGGYYPSRNHVLMPAQTETEQIPVPVFRMLGSDPIYQYDLGLDLQKGSAEWQGVLTLEPANKSGGGNPDWVDWYLANNFSGNCLYYGYAQAGQENNFGWDVPVDSEAPVAPGMQYQMEKISRLVNENKLEVLTLGQTGQWFGKTFSKTPPTTVVARDESRMVQSIWYNCRHYRINLYAEGDKCWIRDIHKFDETYAECYITRPALTKSFQYNTLPVIDGNRWSGNNIRAGIYFTDNGRDLTFSDILYQEENENAIVTLCGTSRGDIRLTLSEDKIIIKGEKTFSMEWRVAPERRAEYLPAAEGGALKYVYEGHRYELRVPRGFCSNGHLKSDENHEIMIATGC